MLFSGLADRLQGVFKNLRGRGRLSESDVNECLREIRLALLEADVNFKVVKDFVARVKTRAVGLDVLESLNPAQQVVKIVYEELTEMMGGAHRGIAMASEPPTVIMMVGLQGSGKLQRRQNWRVSLRNKESVRYSLQRIYTARQQCNNCKRSVSSWTSRYLL